MIRPIAAFTSTPAAALVRPDSVTFDGSASSDTVGTITDYKWDLDGSGNFATDTGTTPKTTFTYTTPGTVQRQPAGHQRPGPDLHDHATRSSSTTSDLRQSTMPRHPRPDRPTGGWATRRRDARWPTASGPTPGQLRRARSVCPARSSATPPPPRLQRHEQLRQRRRWTSPAPARSRSSSG